MSCLDGLLPATAVAFRKKGHAEARGDASLLLNWLMPPRSTLIGVKRGKYALEEGPAGRLPLRMHRPALKGPRLTGAARALPARSAPFHKR